jgi:NAD(P)H-hydrate epimerase
MTPDAGPRARTVTAAEMRAIDRAAIEGLGIPALALMENAGRAVADAVAAACPAGGLVAVLCGHGNNGGDGLVAARHLVGRGYAVTCRHVGGEPRGDAAVHAAVWRAMGFALDPADPGLGAWLAAADVVVDALLGTGLSGEVRPPYAAAIAALNAAGRPVVAVDLPSGLDADDGRVLGACVRATTTVTFALRKRGCMRGAGPAHCGAVVVADIGIPPQAIERVLGPS